ncbi:MAG: FecR family protein [Nannocystaceae bacterium]|nr:FecR family protein [Nannocystaceae bacterium]
MSDERALQGLGRAIAAAQDDAAPEPAHAQVRARLLQTASAPAPSRRGTAMVAAFVAVAAAVLLVLALRPRALTFEVGDTPGVAGQWLASVEAPQPLHFSDGSAVVLAPASRARVVQLRERGAQLVLESGAATASIVPTPGASWQLDAGPYRVDVTGTRFELAWEPARGRFALALHEGSVVVHGPGLEQPRTMNAGETLVLGETLAQAAEPAAPSPAPTVIAGAASEPAPAPAIEPVAPAPAIASEATPRPRARARPSAPEPAADDWRTLAERASYREALAAAEAQGWQSLCEGLPSRELLRLADVARFARRPERAIEALDAVRERFAGSDAAAMAAFERGRIAFARGTAWSDAARWFARYLDERPQGSIAREATGRLMESQQRAGQAEAASATAVRYRARWPDGPDRDLADRILAEP